MAPRGVTPTDPAIHSRPGWDASAAPPADRDDDGHKTITPARAYGVTTIAPSRDDVHHRPNLLRSSRSRAAHRSGARLQRRGAAVAELQLCTDHVRQSLGSFAKGTSWSRSYQHFAADRRQRRWSIRSTAPFGSPCGRPPRPDAVHRGVTAAAHFVQGTSRCSRRPSRAPARLQQRDAGVVTGPAGTIPIDTVRVVTLAGEPR